MGVAKIVDSTLLSGKDAVRATYTTSRDLIASTKGSQGVTTPFYRMPERIDYAQICLLQLYPARAITFKTFLQCFSLIAMPSL